MTGFQQSQVIDDGRNIRVTEAKREAFGRRKVTPQLPCRIAQLRI
jgi:hypothetical protein